MKRNIALIKKWVSALKSGKYHQTTDGQLCHVRGNQTFHCCLGVACRVAAKNGFDIKTMRSGDVPYDGDKHINELGADDAVSFEYKGYGSDITLPRTLLHDIGLTQEEESDLIKMNDEGQSFKSIARWIENNILRRS